MPQSKDTDCKLDKKSKPISVLYPGKFPSPSKTGLQHSNAENTENTTKIFHKKSDPKAHNYQIHRRSLGRNSTSQKSGGQYSTSLKKRTFNPEFYIQPN